MFYEGALAMRGNNFEAGGFMAFTPGTSDEMATNSWAAVPGLLMGAAGVGLSLLAATTYVEPCWDRHLLAQVPLDGCNRSVEFSPSKS